MDGKAFQLGKAAAQNIKVRSRRVAVNKPQRGQVDATLHGQNSNSIDPWRMGRKLSKPTEVL